MKKIPMIFCSLAAVAMLASCGPRTTTVSTAKPTIENATYNFVSSFKFDSQTGGATYEGLNQGDVTEKDGKIVANFSDYEKVMFLVVYYGGFDTLIETKCTLGGVEMKEEKHQGANPQFYFYEATATNGNFELVFTAKVQQSTL